MKRHEVCQGFINLNPNCSYLEIGVNEGLTFHRIEAAKKVAVDPKFLFDKNLAAQDNLNCSYHEMTSDEYFARSKGKDKFGVIYLDGLHTAEQTLRDLLNAINAIQDDGVIIIDDVKPSSYAASLTSIDASVALKISLQDSDQSWMGDVYKLAWFIDSFMQQWTYYTVAENHGQIVMWRQTRRATDLENRLIENVGRLSFADMHKEHHVFRPRSYQTILAAYQASLAD